jgi:hypothetical protein
MTSASTRSPASWWRRQRWYLVGAALLGAWALYVPYRDAWRRYARSHPIVPIDVAQGAQAPYRGARWRLLNLTERDVPRLDEDAMALVARFELVLDEGVDPNSLGRCEARLSDARERVWKSGYVRITGQRALPTSCNYDSGPDFKGIAPQPGRPWLFEKSFVVPRGLDVRQLRPEIFVIPLSEPDAPGTYLRFIQ